MPDSPSELSSGISVIVKIVPVPGREEKLRERMEFVANLSRAEQGCLRYELFADRSGLPDFYFLAEWVDQESLDAHNQTRHVNDFGKDRSILAKEMTLTFLRRV